MTRLGCILTIILLSFVAPAAAKSARTTASKIVPSRQGEPKRLKEMVEDLRELVAHCAAPGAVVTLTYSRSETFDLVFVGASAKASKCIRKAVPPAPMPVDAPTSCAWVAIAVNEARCPIRRRANKS